MGVLAALTTRTLTWPGAEISHQVEEAGRDFAARRAAAAVASLNRWAGNAEKGKAATPLWDRLEMRLDENLDGSLTRMDLNANGRIAEALL